MITLTSIRFTLVFRHSVLACICFTWLAVNPRISAALQISAAPSPTNLAPPSNKRRTSNPEKPRLVFTFDNFDGKKHNAQFSRELCEILRLFLTFNALCSCYSLIYLNTGKITKFCTSLVRDSLHSLNVKFCDALVLNKRRNLSKRRTKISVKLISAAALNSRIYGKC